MTVQISGHHHPNPLTVSQAGYDIHVLLLVFWFYISPVVLNISSGSITLEISLSFNLKTIDATECMFLTVSSIFVIMINPNLAHNVQNR